VGGGNGGTLVRAPDGDHRRWDLNGTRQQLRALLQTSARGLPFHRGAVLSTAVLWRL
jgi:hypothetical protein